MSKKLSVAIVGAGVGGLASALFLRRLGHAVTLFERFAAPQPIGAGLLLQPTGLAVLRALGLYEAAVRQGARIDRLDGRTRNGRTVIDMRYRDLAPDYFGLGIHRGFLFQVLFDAVQSGDIGLITNCEITRFEPGPDVRLTDTHGKQYAGFDLAVFSDGSDSPARAAAGIVRRDRPYRWGAVWSICPAPNIRSPDVLRQVYNGPRQMAGILPVGRLQPSDPPLVSLFWSLHADEFEAWRRRGLAAWKDEMQAYWPDYAALLHSIVDLQQLTPARYRDVVLQRPDIGNVVFIGDAAHAMSPQLGQGANLALIDAKVLAAAVADALGHGGTIEQATARYARLRRSHVGYYQLASRWLTPVFQGRSRTIGWMRDVFMAPAGRLPVIKRHTLATLVGTKSGIFRIMQSLP
ncbi:MAG: FAD-dependent oxidoreductase [Alphaproteobacteria bacterium]